MSGSTWFDCLRTAVATAVLMTGPALAGLPQPMETPQCEIAQASTGIRVYEKRVQKRPNPARPRTNNRTQQSTAALDIVIGGEQGNKSTDTLVSAAAAAKANVLRDEFERGIVAAEQESNESTGTKAVLARLTALALRALKEDMASFAEAADGLGTFASMDPTGLTSHVVIDDRITRYRRLRDSNSAILTSMRTIAPTFTMELQAIGMPRASIDQAVQAAEQFLTLPAKVLYHDKCDSMCTAAITALEVLRNQWGNWVTDPTKKTLAFKTSFPQEARKKLDTALASFERNMEEMNALENKGRGMK